jgi:hypothetical protein
MHAFVFIYIYVYIGSDESCPQGLVVVTPSSLSIRYVYVRTCTYDDDDVYLTRIITRHCVTTYLCINKAGMFFICIHLCIYIYVYSCYIYIHTERMAQQ